MVSTKTVFILLNAVFAIATVDKVGVEISVIERYERYSQINVNAFLLLEPVNWKQVLVMAISVWYELLTTLKMHPKLLAQHYSVFGLPIYFKSILL